MGENLQWYFLKNATNADFLKEKLAVLNIFIDADVNSEYEYIYPYCYIQMR